MEALTIENLPDEVLAKVFEKLDQKSVFNCALVCRTWKHEIYRSTSLMKCFIFTLENNGDRRTGKRILNALSTERKLVNIRIFAFRRPFYGKDRFFDLGDPFSIPGIPQLIEAHRVSLRSLSLAYCDFDPKLFMDVLSRNENLETVELWYCRMINHSTAKAQMLRKLKNVKVTESEGTNWLDLFSGAQLISLDVHSFSRKLKDLTRFLPRQRSLTNLKVICQKKCISDLMDIKSVLPLRNLIIIEQKAYDNAGYPDPNYINFLQHNGNLLQNLEIGCVISFKVLRFILENLKLLDALSFVIPLTKIDETYNKDFNFVSNIRHLKLLGEITNDKLTSDILGFFPSLESLSIQHECNETCCACACDVLEFIKFPKLRELRVASKRFISRCCIEQSIEIYNIGDIGSHSINRRLAKSLTQSKSIRSISFSSACPRRDAPWTRKYLSDGFSWKSKWPDNVSNDFFCVF